jgi:hypothetical protein
MGIIRRLRKLDARTKSELIIRKHGIPRFPCPSKIVREVELFKSLGGMESKEGFEFPVANVTLTSRSCGREKIFNLGTLEVLVPFKNPSYPCVFRQTGAEMIQGHPHVCSSPPHIICLGKSQYASLVRSAIYSFRISDAAHLIDMLLRTYNPMDRFRSLESMELCDLCKQSVDIGLIPKGKRACTGCGVGVCSRCVQFECKVCKSVICVKCDTSYKCHEPKETKA